MVPDRRPRDHSEWPLFPPRSFSPALEVHPANGLDTVRSSNVITVLYPRRGIGARMKARVVRIGNSQGIRIPKSVIEQCHLHGAVDLEIQQGQLVIRSAAKPRAGWDDAFAQMHRHGDDRLTDQESAAPSTWDRNEWTW